MTTASIEAEITGEANPAAALRRNSPNTRARCGVGLFLRPGILSARPSLRTEQVVTAAIDDSHPIWRFEPAEARADGHHMLQALRALNAGPDSEHSPPTKHGGV